MICLSLTEDCGAVSDKWEAVCDTCGSFGTKKWHLYIEKNEGAKFAEVPHDVAEQIPALEKEEDDD